MIPQLPPSKSKQRLTAAAMLSSWNSIALFFANSSWVLSPTLRRHWLHDILEYHAVLLESLSTACAAFMISLKACARSSREPQNRLCHIKAAGERELSTSVFIAWIWQRKRAHKIRGRLRRYLHRLVPFSRRPNSLIRFQIDKSVRRI